MDTSIFAGMIENKKKQLEEQIALMSDEQKAEELQKLCQPLAKRSCNHCYGRGVQNWLVGDGYHNKEVDYGKFTSTERVPNPKRITRPCRCTKILPTLTAK